MLLHVMSRYLVRSGLVSLCQIRSCYVRLCDVMPVHVMLGHVSLRYARLVHVNPGCQILSGYLRLVRVRSD
jgi:hypothetical protein